MRLSGKVLSALGGLVLSISIAHPASAGGTPGGIGGAQFTTAELDFAGRAADVDLELILAVDVSGSMGPDELQLQRDGYVAAFRDPDLIAAVADGELGGIAVMYFEWAGPKDQTVLRAVVGPVGQRGRARFRREPGSRAVQLGSQRLGSSTAISMRSSSRSASCARTTWSASAG